MQQRTPMGAIPRMGMAGIGVPGAPGMQMGMRPPVMGMHGYSFHIRIRVLLNFV